MSVFYGLIDIQVDSYYQDCVIQYRYGDKHDKYCNNAHMGRMTIHILYIYISLTQQKKWCVHLSASITLPGIKPDILVLYCIKYYIYGYIFISFNVKSGS